MLFSFLTTAELTNADMQKAVKFIDTLIPQLIGLGKKILIALVVYIIGKQIIKWTVKLLRKVLNRSSIEQGVVTFLTALTKIISYLILTMIIISIFWGAGAGSLAAILGSAGITVGLAMQGSLANFVGGILILVMKPFRVNDYIITSGNEGTVIAIDVFYTRLLTADNRMVVIPNGTLSNSNITNVTNEPIRRLDLTMSVDYSENIKKVKGIIGEVVSREEKVLKEKETQVFVNSFDPSAITIGIRIWVETSEYWNVKFALLEELKEAFDHNHIVIPYDQLDVNVHQVSKQIE